MSWLSFHCLGAFCFKNSQATNTTMSLWFFKHFLFLCVSYFGEVTCPPAIGTKLSWAHQTRGNYKSKKFIRPSMQAFLPQPQKALMQLHVSPWRCSGSGPAGNPQKQTLPRNTHKTSGMFHSTPGALWPFTPLLHRTNCVKAEMCCQDNEHRRIYSRCYLKRLRTMQNYLCPFKSINLLL